MIPIVVHEGVAKVELAACFLWLIPSALLSQLRSAAPPRFVTGHGKLDPEYPVSLETSFGLSRLASTKLLSLGGRHLDTLIHPACL